jgi:hypothetical protein
MTDRHLALVRFITARQADLRGLREVTFAVLVCAAITVILWRREIGRPAAWLLLLVLGIVVQEVALRVVEWRYNATYGRVNQEKHRQKRTTTAQTLLFTGMFLDMFTPCFRLTGISAFPIVIAVYGLRIALRDFPWRAYYLGGVVLVLAGPGIADASRNVSYLSQYFTGASFLVLTGLLDHLLLAVSMARLKQAAPLPDGANRCPTTVGPLPDDR